jgi:gluconolactonase
MKTHLKLTIAAGLLFGVCTSMRTHNHNKIAISGIDTTGDLFDANAKPQLISKQFSFTEGASTDKKGNVFFTDQNNDKIWEYDADGKLSVFLDSAGRSNGMYMDKKGNLIACADEHEQLWSISPKKKITVLLTDYQGHLFNGPNDVWVNRKTGGLYITDPYYQRKWWTRKKSDLDGQKVYYVPANSSKAVVVADDLQQPNGIVGTPDGKYLYVADIKANKTYKYTINKDGSLSNKTLFVWLGSDGMTLDERGNVYLTGNGVTIYNPQGKQIGHIAIDEPWTANLCFAGKNKDILFMTATKAVYIMQMKVKGVE